MSQYTTEVRYICERAAGLNASAPANEVDNIISAAWNSIFYTRCTFFDESYRAVLCKKILKHYYTREIGAESAGLWKLWMNTKLEEIMPYYNQLYQSALLEFNPLYNTSLTKSSTRTVNKEDENSTEITSNETGTEEIDGTASGSSTGTTAGTSLYSDTPQGSISGLDTGTYLTNATKNSGSTSDSSSSSNSTDRETSSSLTRSEDRAGSEDTTETYSETIAGNSGQNNSESLLKFRETLINIDMMVIDEFKDLFFNLW